MSTNEEAVTKQPKRRKAATKRKAATSPKKRKKVAFAETPIIITGGLLDGQLGVKIVDAQFQHTVINADRYITHNIVGGELVSLIVRGRGGRVIIPLTPIPELDRAYCRVEITVRSV